jgi:hypothetical protein
MEVAAMIKKRFECFDAGCSVVIERPTETELVEAVNRHMAEAHDTFELEDVILANSVDIES